MGTIKQNSIDKAFVQAMQNLSKKHKRVLDKTVLYIEFSKSQTKLFLHTKGEQLKQIQFSELMSRKMIGLGISIEKIYMSLQWLKSICQRDNKGIESLSFFLFSTTQTNQAVLGVCLNNKHFKSYFFSDVLKQFDSKQEHLN